MNHTRKKLLILTLASSLAFSGAVLAKGKPDHADKVKTGNSMKQAKDKVKKDHNEMYDRLQREGDDERSEVAKWEQEDRAESAEMRARHRAEMDALKSDESLSGKDRAQQMKALRDEHHDEKENCT